MELTTRILGQQISLDCHPIVYFAKRSANYLPHNAAIGSVQVALARLINHTLLGPKTRVDPSRPYDRLVLEVKDADLAKAPLFDMDLGLVGYPDLLYPQMRRIPEKINYDLLRGWVRHCDLNHTKCRQSHDRKLLVPGFQVIDCRTRKIVQITSNDLSYVVLSYVWGQQGAMSSTGADFPRTIEDSITVTVALGHQYLWVDKYVRARSTLLSAS